VTGTGCRCRTGPTWSPRNWLPARPDDEVVARASRPIAAAIAELAAAELERQLAVTTNGRGRGRVARAALRRPPREELTKWVADRRARRVPTFVIELTGGLDTEKRIVAKFGANAAFEKGKPPASGAPPERAMGALVPLLRGAVENLAMKGLPGALTGPASRGDAEVVAGQLGALATLAPPRSPGRAWRACRRQGRESARGTAPQGPRSSRPCSRPRLDRRGKRLRG
jgi:hypothetical protein